MSSTYNSAPTEAVSAVMSEYPFVSMPGAFDRKRKHDSISYEGPLSPLSPCSPDDQIMMQMEKRLKIRRHSTASNVTAEPLGLPSPESQVDETSSRLAEIIDVIRAQFGYEILTKHNELRLIQAELAKCQIALEQLRRCHLIPYPVNVPTPSQMVDIARGHGPAVKWPGENVAKWAPPFGVIDGPYARHLSKWLIPDPVFDGGVPETMLPADALRPVKLPQNDFIGKRSTRSGSTAKHGYSSSISLPVVAAEPVFLHATVPSVSTPAKEKQGLPSCVVKRSDGVIVRLQCVRCERSGFSSTQGFINHCRIAHRLDYKSHDEAAFKTGIPIDEKELAGMMAAPPAPISVTPAAVVSLAQPTGVHNLNRADITESDVCSLLLSRIKDTQKLMSASKDTLARFGRNGQQLPHALYDSQISRASRDLTATNDKFAGCGETPALSKYLASKNVSFNLTEIMSELTDESSDEESDGYNSDGDVVMTPSAKPRLLTGSRPTLVIKRHVSIISRESSEGIKTPGQSHELLESTQTPQAVTSHGAPSLVYDSNSEEDEVASVARAGSPNIDVADASGDESSHDHHFHRSMDEDTSMDCDYELPSKPKVNSSKVEPRIDA